MIFPNNDKISISQLRSTLILSVIGVGILGLPRTLSEAAGTDGWFLLIMAGTIVTILAYIYGYIIQSFPGMNWFEVLSINLSRPIAYIVSVYFFIYFIVTAGYVIRIFAAVIKMMLLLRNTPREILVLSFLLVVGYVGRKGIETLGRLAESLVIPLLIFTIIIFAVSTEDIEVVNFLPILQTSPIDLVKGLPSIIFNFLGIELILIFGSFVNKPKDSAKTSAMATLIILVVYFFLIASVLGLLGDQQMRYLVWPAITALESVYIGGGFIENIAVLLMSVWVIVAFTTVAPIYLASGIMLSEIFKTKEYNYLTLPLIPILYTAANWSKSLADVYKDLEVINRYMGIGVLVIIPLILLIVMKIRKTHKVIKKEI